MAIPLWRLPLGRPPRLADIGYHLHHGSETGSYRLAGLWSLHLFRWRGSVDIDGVGAVPILPRHAGIAPPDRLLRYRFAPRSEHVYAHFALEPDALPAIEAPALIELGPRFERIWLALREAADWHRTLPARAAARFAEVLWSVLPAAAPPRAHPAVAKARRLIEWRLSEPVSAAAIAREAGCSHNQLNRLFHAALGTTVLGYVLSRRMTRARFLLENSTEPIGAIAAQVGIPDPRYFNKLVRRELGASPRAIRRAVG